MRINACKASQTESVWAYLNAGGEIRWYNALEFSITRVSLQQNLMQARATITGNLRHYPVVTG